MLKEAVVCLVLLLYEIPRVQGISLVNQVFRKNDFNGISKRSDINVADLCVRNFELCKVIDAIVKARTPPEDLEKEKIKEIVREELGPLIRKRRNPEDDLIRLFAGTPHPGSSSKIRTFGSALFSR